MDLRTADWLVTVRAPACMWDDIYVSQVGGLTDVYAFVLTDHPKRTTSAFVDKSKHLAGEDGVSLRADNGRVIF